MTYYEKTQILNNLVQDAKQEYPDRTLRWHIKRICNFFQVQLLLRDLSNLNTIGYSRFIANPHPLYPRCKVVVVEKNLTPSKRLVTALYLIATHAINEKISQDNYIVKTIPSDIEKGSHDDTLCKMFVSDIALDTNKLEEIIKKADQVKGGTHHV